MDTVVILDCDKKWIANYKRMLSSIQDPMDCRFFQRPEDAIQFLTEYPAAALACEQDMPFMSGIEVFQMVDMLSPETVKVIITENKDVAKTLDTINSSQVYRLIVKPFFMVEDIEKPLREALAYYQEGKKQEEAGRQKELQLESLEQRISGLSKELDGKRQRYAVFSQVAEGMIQGNLGREFVGLSQEEAAFAAQACEALLQEFMRYYMFEQHGCQYHMKYLTQFFHRPKEGYIFQLSSQAEGEIPPEMMSRIGYGMFLMGYLCQKVLSECQVAMGIRKEEGGYALRMACRYPQDGSAFRISSPRLRQILGHVVEKVAKSLASQMAGAFKGQGFAVRLMFQQEGSAQ